MTGPDIEDLEMQGIIPRMVRNVFNRIETAEESIVFEVKVSTFYYLMPFLRLNFSQDNRH